MKYLFEGHTFFNHPIGHWDTSLVTNMEGMFQQCTKFNQPIGGWNTSSVRNMSEMFDGAEAFNNPIGAWNTSSVTRMHWMFCDAVAFNQPIGAWNTRSVTNMQGMFENAAAFNQPIGGWNTSSVTNMREMFSGARAFNQDISHWVDRLREDIGRVFAKMMLVEDVTKTVRRLSLNLIFRQRPPDLAIRSVKMLELVRLTYPGYRPSQVEYEKLHELLGQGWKNNLQKKRAITLIDLLNREEANLPPRIWYNKTKSREIIRSINKPTNSRRAVAIDSIGKAAAKKQLHLPKELVAKILHAASIKVLPYTHARGSNRRTGNGR